MSRVFVVIFSLLWVAYPGIFGTSNAAELAAERDTRTPIKHLIVVVGENHGFDNVFATYMPRDPMQRVWNLLSLGIVNRV